MMHPNPPLPPSLHPSPPANKEPQPGTDDISRWEENRSSDYIVDEVLREDPQSHRQSGMPDTEDNLPDEPELLNYRTDPEYSEASGMEAVEVNKIDFDDGVPDEDVGEHQM